MANLKLRKIEVRLPNPLDGNALRDDRFLYARHFTATRIAKALELFHDEGNVLIFNVRHLTLICHVISNENGMTRAFKLRLELHLWILIDEF